MGKPEDLNVALSLSLFFSAAPSLTGLPLWNCARKQLWRVFQAKLPWYAWVHEKVQRTCNSRWRVTPKVSGLHQANARLISFGFYCRGARAMKGSVEYSKIGQRTINQASCISKLLKCPGMYDEQKYQWSKDLYIPVTIVPFLQNLCGWVLDPQCVLPYFHL